MFNNKTILITGGTGTFGNNFIKLIKNKKINFKKIIIFSRDEFKQHEMANKFARQSNLNLRFFIGDIRDKDRLRMAFENVDIVIHAAALKQVPTAEYNPFEAIKTNVIGTQNLIEVSLEKNIKKFIALSTDKAAAPINLYGATKLCSDKLTISSNNIKGNKPTLFSVVRYGNVMASRGSVIPEFIRNSKNNFLEITDLNMTRFSITIEEAIEVVFWAIKNSIGGEIIVPKIPSYRLVDLAKAICPKCKLKVTGIRPGEKLHEEMITISDSYNTFDIGKYYIILDNINLKNLSKYPKTYKIKKVHKNFSYNSLNNPNFLTVKEIINLVKKISIDN
jgi:UDP-N-acetylglucosamine 4,6-dehydratase